MPGPPHAQLLVPLLRPLLARALLGLLVLLLHEVLAPAGLLLVQEQVQEMAQPELLLPGWALRLGQEAAVQPLLAQAMTRGQAWVVEQELLHPPELLVPPPIGVPPAPEPAPQTPLLPQRAVP